MKKRMRKGILLSSVLALCCCVSGVAIKTLGYETKAEGNDFFVNEANYTGSLTPGNINFDTGFCSIPVTQGDNGWYVKGGPDMESLTEMTAQNNGNTYDDGKGYGFWWRQDYGIWVGGVLVNEWKAPQDGEVKFSGKILLNAPEETVLSLYHRATTEGTLETIYSSQMTAGTKAVMIQDESFKKVKAGESYYFAISEAHPEKGDAGKAHGRIHVKADFKSVDKNAFILEPEAYSGEVTKENAIDENGFKCIPDPNTEEQGTNNWYAAFGQAIGDYKKMTKETNHWQGKAQYNSIWWGHEFSPDVDDAMAVWKAPFNGKVKFSGVIYKDGMSGSDGVGIAVYNKKSRSSETEKIIQVNKNSDFILYINEKELEVVSGEMYFFSVNQLGNSAFDTTKMFIKADFLKDELNPGKQSENEIEPLKENPADCIFNITPAYVLEEDSKYYGVPTNQGDNNTYILSGKVEDEYYEMTRVDENGDHWQGNSDYNSIYWKQDFSPDGGNDAIIAWKAPYNGTVRFTGRVTKNFNNVSSDGIILKAFNRKTLDSELKELYKKNFDETFTVYFNGVDIEVVSGEMYFFAIDQGNSSDFDTTKLFFKAEFTKNEIKPGEMSDENIGCSRKVDFLKYYSNEQGKNNWFYAMGSIEKYALMEYGVSKNSGQLQWNGLSDWQGISAGNITPGKEYANLRIYVCDRDAIISIEGKLNKTGNGGDGLNAKIYLNDKVFFEHSFGAESSIVKLPSSLRNIEVKQGDLIIYYVDCGSAGSNDYDNITFACELFVEKELGEANKDISKFIKPVSKLELLGVNMPDYIPDQNEDYVDSEENTSGCNGVIKVPYIMAIATIIFVGVVLVVKKNRGNNI